MSVSRNPSPSMCPKCQNWKDGIAQKCNSDLAATLSNVSLEVRSERRVELATFRRTKNKATMCEATEVEKIVVPAEMLLLM